RSRVGDPVVAEHQLVAVIYPLVVEDVRARDALAARRAFCQFVEMGGKVPVFPLVSGKLGANLLAVVDAAVEGVGRRLAADAESAAPDQGEDRQDEGIAPSGAT